MTLTPVEWLIPRSQSWPGPGPAPDFTFVNAMSGVEYWPDPKDVAWRQMFDELQALRERVAELEAQPHEQSSTAKLEMACRLLQDVIGAS